MHFPNSFPNTACLFAFIVDDSLGGPCRPFLPILVHVIVNICRAISNCKNSTKKHALYIAK